MYLKVIYLAMTFIIGILVGKGIYEPTNILNETSLAQTHSPQSSSFTDEANFSENNIEIASPANPVTSLPTTSKFENIKEKLPLFNDESDNLSSNQYWQNVLYISKDIPLKLRAIENLVTDGAFEELAYGLNDNSDIIRRETILGLGQISTSDSIRIVGQVLFSELLISNRQLAITVLEEHIYLPHVSYFLEYALKKDPEVSIRKMAAQALGVQYNEE
jgi:hypothetical protein